MLKSFHFGLHVCRCANDSTLIKNRLLPRLMQGAVIINKKFHTYPLYIRKNIKFTEYMGRKSFASLQILDSFRNFSSVFDERNCNKLVVYHDSNKRIFYVDVNGGGYVEYDKQDDLIILKHTFVSNELEGRGVGRILAKEALEYVAKNDLQLEIQCSFIRKYVSIHEPKYIKYIPK